MVRLAVGVPPVLDTTLEVALDVALVFTPALAVVARAEDPWAGKSTEEAETLAVRVRLVQVVQVVLDLKVIPPTGEAWAVVGLAAALLVVVVAALGVAVFPPPQAAPLSAPADAPPKVKGCAASPYL